MGFFRHGFLFQGLILLDFGALSDEATETVVKQKIITDVWERTRSLIDSSLTTTAPPIIRQIKFLMDDATYIQSPLAALQTNIHYF